MSFLIALFSVFVLYVIWVRDSCAKEATESQVNQTLNRSNDLENKICGVRRKFYKQYGATDEEYSDAFVSAEIMNEKAQKMSKRILEEAGVDKVHKPMIVLGLLAQDLKIPQKAVKNGFRTSWMLNYTWDDGLQDEYKFFIWYDAELRRNGFPYMLVFVGWEPFNTLQNDSRKFFGEARLEYGHWVGDPDFQMEYENASNHRLGGRYWIPQWRYSMNESGDGFYVLDMRDDSY